jgi:hypothetical protein
MALLLVSGYQRSIDDLVRELCYGQRAHLRLCFHLLHMSLFAEHASFSRRICDEAYRQTDYMAWRRVAEGDSQAGGFLQK